MLCKCIISCWRIVVFYIAQLILLCLTAAMFSIIQLWDLGGINNRFLLFKIYTYTRTNAHILAHRYTWTRVGSDYPCTHTHAQIQSSINWHTCTRNHSSIDTRESIHTHSQFSVLFIFYFLLNIHTRTCIHAYAQTYPSTHCHVVIDLWMTFSVDLPRQFLWQFLPRWSVFDR